MYKVLLTNFNYFLEGEFGTLDDAIMAGRNAGFEFAVYKDGEMVGYTTGVWLSWYNVRQSS